MNSTKGIIYMNKQEIFPSPLRPHNNNGFDIARRMNNHQHNRRIKKDEKILRNKNSVRSYIAKTVPGKPEQITFCAKRPPVDYKLAVYTAALLVLAILGFTLKISFKVLCGAFCTISMIFFLAAAYSQPRQMKSASLKENF